MKGVAAFYTTKDIPGNNTFLSKKNAFVEEEEEVFVQDKVKYHSQPAGVIVATDMDLALKAAKMVKIVYEKAPKSKILVDMKAVLDGGHKDRIITADTPPLATEWNGKNKILINCFRDMNGNFIIH